MRRLIITTFALLLTNCLLSQQSGKKYSFRQVAWTITLPDDFNMVDSADDSVRMERGKKAIEDANDVKGDVSTTTTLISATKNTYNYFNSTITPFDSTIDGNYMATNKELKNMVYKTMSEKMPDGKIDSITTTQAIDDLIFDKFSLTINIPGKTSFHMILLTKLYKGYDFGITYVYLDEKTGHQIDTMLKNSKFDK
jgi:hypothetical protein